MHILGIETSCDETAVAIVRSGEEQQPDVCADLVSSQISLHAPFGGVVPEIATREHLRNLPRLVIQLFQQSSLTPEDLDAIAVTEGPGLASSLLIGTSYARALGIASSKPVFGINHLEGHLFSPFLTHRKTVEFPFIGLIVSGGHTLLVLAKNWETYQRLGATTDDAAGEAFDKVARLLGLAYPGGPEIERMARKGNPEAYVFPRSYPERDNYNFSFSGLKTAVRYFFEKNSAEHGNQAWIADLCASFQKAVIDVLTRKAVQSALNNRVKTVAASGGVMANETLRQALARACAANEIELLVADPKLCTDNAVMIASTALQKMAAGIKPRVSDDIQPNLGLVTSSGRTDR